MFEEVFSKLHSVHNEIKMIGIWGKDGLELERKDFNEFDGIDLELVGAELADLISKIDSIKIPIESYLLRFNLNASLLMIFSLTENYFLIVLTEKKIIIGKLKFYIDICKEKLIADL